METSRRGPQAAGRSHGRGGYPCAWLQPQGTHYVTLSKCRGLPEPVLQALKWWDMQREGEEEKEGRDLHFLCLTLSGLGSLNKNFSSREGPSAQKSPRN